MDPEGSDRKRAMQSGEVHGQPDEQREDGHPSQTCPNSKEKRLDTGEERGGLCEIANKAVKNALEEELIAEMYEMIL